MRWRRHTTSERLLYVLPLAPGSVYWRKCKTADDVYCTGGVGTMETEKGRGCGEW